MVSVRGVNTWIFPVLVPCLYVAKCPYGGILSYPIPHYYSMPTRVLAFSLPQANPTSFTPDLRFAPAKHLFAPPKRDSSTYPDTSTDISFPFAETENREMRFCFALAKRNSSHV